MIHLNVVCNNMYMYDDTNEVIKIDNETCGMKGLLSA